MQVLLAAKAFTATVLFGRTLVRAATAQGCPSLALHPTEDTFAVGTIDGYVMIWDAARGTQIAKMNGHWGATRCIAWAPEIDGSESCEALFTGGGARGGNSAGSVLHWQPTQTTNVWADLRGHDAEVDQLVFSEGSVMATLCTRSPSVRVWSPIIRGRSAGGTVNVAWKSHAQARRYLELQQALDTEVIEPRAIAWGSIPGVGLHLAVVCGDGLRVFNADTGEHNLVNLQYHQDLLDCSEVCTCTWSPCGTWLAFGLKRGAVILCNTATWTIFPAQYTHGGPATSLSWSHSPPYKLASAGGHMVAITIPDTRENQAVYKHEEVQAVSWGNHCLGSSCMKGYVHLREVIDGNVVQPNMSKVLRVYARSGPLSAFSEQPSGLEMEDMEWDEDADELDDKDTGNHSHARAENEETQQQYDRPAADPIHHHEDEEDGTAPAARLPSSFANMIFPH